MLDQKTYRHLLSHQSLDRMITGELGAEALQYVEDLLLWLDRDQNIICASRPLASSINLSENSTCDLGVVGDWLHSHMVIGQAPRRRAPHFSI